MSIHLTPSLKRQAKHRNLLQSAGRFKGKKAFDSFLAEPFLFPVFDLKKQDARLVKKLESVTIVSLIIKDLSLSICLCLSLFLSLSNVQIIIEKQKNRICFKFRRLEVHSLDPEVAHGVGLKLAKELHESTTIVKEAIGVKRNFAKSEKKSIGCDSTVGRRGDDEANSQRAKKVLQFTSLPTKSNGGSASANR